MVFHRTSIGQLILICKSVGSQSQDFAVFKSAEPFAWTFSVKKLFLKTLSSLKESTWLESLFDKVKNCKCWRRNVCVSTKNKSAWSKTSINSDETCVQRDLQQSTNYLRQTLVFMRNTELRKKINFYFTEVFYLH